MEHCRTEEKSGQPYEIIEYAKKLPFRIHNITRGEVLNEQGKAVHVLGHWHREIEIVYTFAGHATHYADGRACPMEPDGIFIVNSESIHKVISDVNVDESIEVIAVVLIVNYDFIRQLVNNMDEMYFLNCAVTDRSAARKIMEEFSRYADGRRAILDYEELRLTGLMYELMHLLCRDALVRKDNVLPINTQKNLERLRGIMLYVNEHYAEPVTQQEVAKRFYFTKEYFSRFFKKNMGMTFKEYLTKYRLCKTREEILYTNKNILTIAVDHGFSDSRGLILAFREVYGMTPLQYRKANTSEEMEGECNFS